jgi:hypothetical protein
MLARFPPDLETSRRLVLVSLRRCLSLLYAQEELATVTVVTGLCGYVIPHHQFLLFITEVSEHHHLRASLVIRTIANPQPFRIYPSVIRRQNFSPDQYRSDPRGIFGIYGLVCPRHAKLYQERVHGRLSSFARTGSGRSNHSVD